MEDRPREAAGQRHGSRLQLLQEPGPEGRAIWDQMHPIVIDGPDGRYMVPRSSISGMSAPVGGGVTISPGYNIRGGAVETLAAGFR